MFEATRDFFNDAMNFQLSNQLMVDILCSLAGIGDKLSFGEAMLAFHHLTPRERNYVCCVLLERDQDIKAWTHLWDSMESEAFC